MGTGCNCQNLLKYCWQVTSMSDSLSGEKPEKTPMSIIVIPVLPCFRYLSIKFKVQQLLLALINNHN